MLARIANGNETMNASHTCRQSLCDQLEQWGGTTRERRCAVTTITANSSETDSITDARLRSVFVPARSGSLPL